MICSCFNEQSGQYDYFETATNFPFNADLPVPKLPPVAGKVGVPAVDAGRPLPRDAQFVGSGWTAKGVVVGCSRPPVKPAAGFGASDLSDLAPYFWGGIAAAALATYLIIRSRR